MNKIRQVPAWLSAPLIVGAFGLLWLMERRRPLRRAVEGKLTRHVRNMMVAGAGAAALQLVERPLVQPLTRLVERRRWGLLKVVRLPAWLEVTLAVILMDYTLYVWHVLTHKAPLLWRFHVVHHVDLDLDASTALRFHFGELTISTAWRAAQVLLIGVSPLAFSVWQTFLLLSVLFHHSNVRLPIETERLLNRFVVTPRMHGIHHSIIREETNSNWSSGLTLWDWLHGTLKINVPQEEITIGVPAFRESKAVELIKVLCMPFGEQRTTWNLPGGVEPARIAASNVAPDHLLP
ncbi:MAG TPA: sterol desaturase family protein [Pyrinomonadaceae bacterium]|nr:sterol desaturase family protein [Pyrinomonadaceae bacterium]